MSLQYHPDRGGNALKFTALTEARNRLKEMLGLN
jgi:hypothetical protein